MEYYYLILVFIFGSIMGSFYQVIGERLPKGESLVKPKYSYCPNCKKRLKWYELIPVFSYVIQLGKCRKCKKVISPMYPFIEIVTGALFAVSYYSFGVSYEFGVSIALISFFSIVIVSDLTYMIIPDEVTLITALAIIIINFLNLGIKDGFIHIGYGIITFLFMYSIMLLGNFLFKKESLGGADVKLMFLAGLVLHPVLGITAVFIGSCIALPISLVILLTDQDHMIPFGPFLVAGIILLYFLKIDLNQFFQLFS